MATVNKDFRVKHGLVVEGTTATVNGSNVLTEASTAFLNNIIKDQSGDLLANATLTNLTISYDDVTNALTITAENGVADSDTDDLAEGTVNLYFTDARAVAAVENGTFSSIQVDTLTTGSGALNIDGGVYISSQEGNAYITVDGNTLATEGYADQAEADAITSSNSYTDGRETAITAAYEAYADQAEADAISSANSYTDGRETAITSAYEAYADTAESDAISTSNTYTDNLIGDVTVDGTAGNTVTDRIDTAISNLIGGAPELLDTLDEIAAAIADDENFSTTVLSDIAQGLTDAKAYTDGRETAITTAYQAYADTAEADAISSANSYTDGRETAITTAYEAYADQAEADAIATAAADATSKANTAESNANTFTTNSIDALDTDDIEEGTSNLYFTDQRAVDALEAVVPNFTEVDINSVAKQVAATASLADTNQTAVYSFDSTAYRSAKFVVKAAYSTHTEVSEVIVTLDTSDNIAITEYAVVGTNGSLGTITAGMDGTDVELLYTAGSNSTDVSVFGTLIA